MRQVSGRVLGAWIAAVLALAWVGRPLAEQLRAAGVLRATVLGLGAAVAAAVWRATPQPERAPVLATVAAALLLGSHWALPEERIHLVQYLPLGWLAVRALGPRGLLLALGVGVADEALQAALPSRTFDPWDVAANAVAAGAGALLASGRRAWVSPALLVAAFLAFEAAHAPAGRPAPTPMVTPAPAPVVDTGAADPTAPFPDASILLVTVDALRADAIPPWGAPPTPLPAFERLAAESVAAKRGVANALWTSPSIVTLLTGEHPARHGVLARGREFTRPTALAALAAQGWATAGFSGPDDDTYRGLPFATTLDRDDPVGSALDALQTERSFVWLHLRNVHAPYDVAPARLSELGLPSSLPAAPVLDRARARPTVPRADFPGDHRWLQPALRALYAAEVVDADGALGRLLDGLDARGLDPIVVLTADHGEELLERGGVGHASTTLDSAVWPELVDIPWLLRLPGREPGRLEGIVEQTDLLPTVLSLVGRSSLLPAHDGRDWSAALLGGAAPPPRTPLVTSSPCGWQCPPERRAEVVHGLAGEPWLRCREPDCPEAIRARVDALSPGASATPPARPPPPSR